MWAIAVHAIESGIVLSVVVFGVLLAVLRANPEIMLNDYPPDIRVKWGPMSDRTKRQRVGVAVLLLIAGGLVALWSVKPLSTLARGDVTFAIAFVHFAIMLETFNFLDWIALDWPLVYLRPGFVVLPGTEGLPGYRNYWFHFRGFLIGVPLVLAASAFLAALVPILYRR